MGIKAKSGSIVKAAFGLRLATTLLVAAFLTPHARATENALQAPAASSLPKEIQKETEDEALPDIEARAFAAKVVRRSSSSRTYLFDDVDNAKPTVGRILLLRREQEPLMAFRVLKNYPDQGQFAARRLRRYGDIKHLQNGDSYVAVEKVGDLTPVAEPAPNTEPAPTMEPGGPRVPTSKETAEGNQDKADLKEIENAAPFDSELDKGSSPAPQGTGKDDDFDEPMEDDSESPNAIDESHTIEKSRHGLSAQAGYFRSNTLDGQAQNFAGAGLRYGLTLGKTIFLRKATPQDSFTIEGGAFLYKVIGLVVKTAGSNLDAYTVMPLMIHARYNVHFNEDLTVFVYGGFVQNRVIASSQAPPSGISALSSGFPGGGGGVLYRLGPGWYARLDLGIDMMGGGLAIRF